MKQNYNIVVTGGTGFIGSHLVEELILSKNEIFVPYIEFDPKSYFSIKKLKKNVHLTKLDLRDQKKLNIYLKDNKIDFIFHLAAQTIVEKAYNSPYETLHNNIVSTLDILEYARENKHIKGVIIASSDKAYGKTTKKYNEDTPLKGDHPYDVSKSAIDLITQTYYKTYKTPVVITRFGNVYGEGDLHLNRIVPGICESLALNKQLYIRSDGTFVRDYIYVKDVVSAYIFLFKNFDSVLGEAFNVSSSDTLSVIDLITKIQIRTDKKINYKIQNTTKNEIPYQHLDDSKIRDLGWSPKYNLSNTIEGILKWYKSILKNNL